LFRRAEEEGVAGRLRELLDLVRGVLGGSQ